MVETVEAKEGDDMEVDISKLADHDPCEFARNRYNGIAKWRFLWTLLIFIFGAFLLLLLIVALFLAIDGNTSGAAASGLGAVADGAGVAFLLARRRDAKREEEAAYRDVEEKCGSTADADALVAPCGSWESGRRPAPLTSEQEILSVGRAHSLAST